LGQRRDCAAATSGDNDAARLRSLLGLLVDQSSDQSLSLGQKRDSSDDAARLRNLLVDQDPDNSDDAVRLRNLLVDQRNLVVGQGLF